MPTNCIAKKFTKAAECYDHIALLQRRVGEELLSKIHRKPFEQIVIADVGGGTGYFAAHLKSKFPQATVVNIDIAPGMLSQAAKYPSLNLIEADFDKLPIKNNAVDLLWSNMALQWSINLNLTLQEINRVLNNHGKLFFNLMGGSSLNELRVCWKAIDDFPHINTFPSIVQVGKSLDAARFNNSRISSQIIRVEYPDVYQLLHEIKSIGANHVYGHKVKTLTGKWQFKKLAEHYEQFRTERGTLPATYEIITGIAEK